MSCQTTNKKTYDPEDKEDIPPPLGDDDIQLLKAYGIGPYTNPLKAIDNKINELQEEIKELIGIKESDTGLSQPSMWDLAADKQMMQEEAPLQGKFPCRRFRILLFLYI